MGSRPLHSSCCKLRIGGFPSPFPPGRDQNPTFNSPSPPKQLLLRILISPKMTSYSSLNPNSPPFFPSLGSIHAHSFTPYDQPASPPLPPPTILQPVLLPHPHEYFCYFTLMAPQYHFLPELQRHFELLQIAAAPAPIPVECKHPESGILPPVPSSMLVGGTARGCAKKSIRSMWNRKSPSQKVAAEECYRSTVKCTGKPRCQRKRPPVETIAPEAFEFGAGDVADEGSTPGNGCGGRTTVMIKNIPNKYTKQMLLSVIDKHCAEENMKLRSELHGGNMQPIFSEYDFFYLPIDFCTGCNLGYAFVNFTSAVAAWRLHRTLHRKAWPLVASRKICEVTYARIQGLKSLRKNFENSRFECNSVDLLPVQFHPPRSGVSRTNLFSSFIGRRVPRTEM